MKRKYILEEGVTLLSLITQEYFYQKSSNFLGQLRMKCCTKAYCGIIEIYGDSMFVHSVGPLISIS